MLRLLFIVASLFPFSYGVSAQQTPNRLHENHGPGVKGPRGGTIQHLGGYEAELVIEGRRIILYLTDMTTGKRARVDNITATIFVVRGSTRRATIVLHHEKGVLHGSAEIPEGTDAVINIRMPDGKSRQARFELD